MADLVEGLLRGHLGTNGVTDGLHRGARGLSRSRGSRGGLVLVGALEERHGWFECSLGCWERGLGVAWVGLELVAFVALRMCLSDEGRTRDGRGFIYSFSPSICEIRNT